MITPSTPLTIRVKDCAPPYPKHICSRGGDARQIGIWDHLLTAPVWVRVLCLEWKAGRQEASGLLDIGPCWLPQRRVRIGGFGCINAAGGWDNLIKRFHPYLRDSTPVLSTLPSNGSHGFRHLLRPHTYIRTMLHSLLGTFLSFGHYNILCMLKRCRQRLLSCDYLMISHILYQRWLAQG